MLNLNNLNLPERSVRQFFLVNDVDEVFDLTSKLEDKTKLYQAFLHLPKGLGSESNDVYTPVYHYQILSQKAWVNSDVSGELNFATYEQYSAFQYFTTHTRSLYLVYVLPFNQGLDNFPLDKTVFAKITITNCTKAEKDKDTGFLKSELTIRLLEPLKSDKVVKQAITINPADQTKTYSYSYSLDGTSYKYGSAEGSYLIIDNLGNAPTFPKIIINGPAQAPVLTLTDFETGELLQVMSIDYALTSSEKMEINGDPLDQYVRVNNINAYDYLNKDLDTYIVLPPGKSILRMEALSGGVEIEYEYKFYSI